MSSNPTPYGEVPPTPESSAALDVKDKHEHHWFKEPTEPVGAKFTLWPVVAHQEGAVTP